MEQAHCQRQEQATSEGVCGKGGEERYVEGGKRPHFGAYGTKNGKIDT